MIQKREFWLMLILTIVTCGIYGIFWWYGFTEDMNRICEGRSQEAPSINYILVILLSFITCGIYGLYWIYKQGNRLYEVAPSYQVPVQMNGTTLLLWYVVGSLICGIGSYIAIYIWIDNFNKLADAYNRQVQTFA